MLYFESENELKFYNLEARSYPAQPAQLHQHTSYKIETSLLASVDMIFSNKRKTKALISLRKRAGWSAPLLFAKPEDRFSSVNA